MAFVPVAIGAGIAAAVALGAGGGTVGGTALSALRTIDHKEEQITDVSVLEKGDHITFVKQHSIIVEIQDRKAKVLMFSNDRNGKVVKNGEIDLTASTGKLFIHKYEPLVCFRKEAVVARAKSLSLDHCPPDQKGLVRKYWQFFKDGEHFANWCHIGLKFSDAWLSKFSPGYMYTSIIDIGQLREGDHVSCGSDVGIVTGIDRDHKTIDAVCYQPRTDDITTALFRVNEDTIYRYDYDISVGKRNQEAKEQAFSELSNRTSPPPYTRSREQFAMWCKTNLPISSTDASVLAKARILGRPWMWISQVEEIQIGDHIAYKPYVRYRHAIVVEKNGNMITCIDRPPNEKEAIRKIQNLDMSDYCGKALCKYLYTSSGEIGAQNVQEQIIKRASSLNGNIVVQLPFKDREHFAMFCKKGSYQLHQ